MPRLLLQLLALCLLCGVAVIISKVVRRGASESEVQAVAERFTQALLRGDVEAMRDDLEPEFDARLTGDHSGVARMLARGESDAQVQVQRVTMRSESRSPGRSIVSPGDSRRAEARVVVRQDKARVSFTLQLVRIGGFWKIAGFLDISQHPAPLAAPARGGQTPTAEPAPRAAPMPEGVQLEGVEPQAVDRTKVRP